MKMLTIFAVASICHEANRRYCETLGDTSQVPWDQAPENIKQSAISGVEFRLKNRGAHPSASHEAWSEFKIKDGWTYGPEKDAEKKTHPCLVAWGDLPIEQRIKDTLFTNVVDAVYPIIEGAPQAEISEVDFLGAAKSIRKEILEVEGKVAVYRTAGIQARAETNIGELRANVTLCFRHLEDARMRMGKALQSFDGGKSCYPS